MAQLYKYYQLVGGSEDWVVTRADTDLTAVSPTFVTILSLDTLDTLPKSKPSRELLDSVRYMGPMYFDLDSDDLQDSINAANELCDKLREEGVQDSDIEIYLSGKKGLHILVSPLVFMERQQAVQFLPAIYKCLAFTFAVPTLDFKVYTARTGRMLRTCYNIRENGNYRVPITAVELKALTVEQYPIYCSAPRTVPEATPAFRAKFALHYDSAKQRISKSTRKRVRPTDATTLQRHLPLVQQLMRGEVAADAGFNKVAIQLAIYAREAGYTPDSLVQASAALINSHVGDGSRYNTPAKREAEIRRMCDYVEDNPAYTYALEPMKALVPKVVNDAPLTSGEEEGENGFQQPTEAFSCGVTAIGNVYVASKGDAGDVAISNFVFDNVIILLSPETGEIVGLKANLAGLSKKPTVVLNTGSFTGSSGLQNAVAAYGGSFTGSDIHARGILQIMLHRSSDSRYILDSEGVNVITVPTAESERLREPFVVWADSAGVRTQPWVTAEGVSFEFAGHPDPRGVIKTDLTMSPTLEQFVSVEGNREVVKATLKALFACQEPDTVGKMLGWMVATFWRQIFHAKHGKFPLLHVYGPAGLGKSEMTTSMLRMFYYRAQPQSVTPSSTPFALLQLVGGSGSIPVLMDEYKPAKMNTEVLERYRSVFRDAYNMKDTQRGGGNRTKDSFNALNRISLSGPIIFVAEAPETETALLERVVLVSIKKPSTTRLFSNFRNFLEYSKNLDVMSALGHTLALRVVQDDSMAGFESEFNTLHDRTIARLMVQPEDYDRLSRGEITQADIDLKVGIKQRAVYNAAVTLFGLLKLKGLVKLIFAEEFDEVFAADFTAMQHGLFSGMNDAALNMQPEYVKLLTTMGDMTMLEGENRLRLVEGLEYNISEIGGRPVLALCARAAYNKYRMYCRQSGVEYYYPNEHSFSQAMREIPQYLKSGTGTLRAQAATLIFDLEDLHRAGVSKWVGRPVPLPV